MLEKNSPPSSRSSSGRRCDLDRMVNHNNPNRQVWKAVGGFKEECTKHGLLHHTSLVHGFHATAQHACILCRGLDDAEAVHEITRLVCLAHVMDDFFDNWRSVKILAPRFPITSVAEIAPLLPNRAATAWRLIFASTAPEHEVLKLANYMIAGALIQRADSLDQFQAHAEVFKSNLINSNWGTGLEGQLATLNSLEISALAHTGMGPFLWLAGIRDTAACLLQELFCGPLLYCEDRLKEAEVEQSSIGERGGKIIPDGALTRLLDVFDAQIRRYPTAQISYLRQQRSHAYEALVQHLNPRLRSRYLLTINNEK